MTAFKVCVIRKSPRRFNVKVEKPCHATAGVTFAEIIRFAPSLTASQAAETAARFATEYDTRVEWID